MTMNHKPCKVCGHAIWDHEPTIIISGVTKPTFCHRYREGCNCRMYNGKKPTLRIDIDRILHKAYFSKLLTGKEFDNMIDELEQLVKEHLRVKNIEDKKTIQKLLDVMGEHMPTVDMWQEALLYLTTICDRLNVLYRVDFKTGEIELLDKKVRK